MTALLEVADLRVGFTVRRGWRREQVAAVDGVSFTLARGEAVALVGASGSGKSTVARAIAGLVRPAGGALRFAGEPVPRRRALPWRRRVQMIFQDPFGSLNPAHTVGYHLERPLLRHRIARGHADAGVRARNLLEQVGLTPAAAIAARFPHQLSGGQRQRVAIARVLAVDPDLICADEPTSMLDVSLRAGILDLLRDLRRTRACTFLLITHDLASAAAFADRVLVMQQGRIVDQGPPAELLTRPTHAYTRTLVEAMPQVHKYLQI